MQNNKYQFHIFLSVSLFVIVSCMPSQNQPKSAVRGFETTNENPTIGANGAGAESLDAPQCGLMYVNSAGGIAATIHPVFNSSESNRLSEGTFVCALGTREKGTWTKVKMSSSEGYIESIYLKCETANKPANKPSNTNVAQIPNCEKLANSSNGAVSNGMPVNALPSNATNSGNSSTNSNVGNELPSNAPSQNNVGNGTQGQTLQCNLVLPFIHWPGTWIDCKSENGEKIATYREDATVIVFKLPLSDGRFKLAGAPQCVFDKNNIDASKCR